MRSKKVIFILDLAAGKEKATAWGCDLTERYVEINGRYTT
jgi:glutamate N-acetyltransferase/amino-acid N-acetyltransferase